jgi:hypothetical protein
MDWFCRYAALAEKGADISELFSENVSVGHIYLLILRKHSLVPRKLPLLDLEDYQSSDKLIRRLKSCHKVNYFIRIIFSLASLKK